MKILSKIIIPLLLEGMPLMAFAQTRSLDHFESTAGWQTIASDAVTIDTSIVAGFRGKALRYDYNFTSGTGYCGIEKDFPMKMPDNFQFTFYLKGNGPLNNLEFKLLDDSGDNVWWLIQRNYDFPSNWKKIIIKKRHIKFAWGPTQDRALKKIAKIQFFVSSATGGHGSVYLDEFSFEPLAVPDTIPPIPLFSVTSELKKNSAVAMGDHNPLTKWHSKNAGPQTVLIDLQKHYEYGGLVIDFDYLDWPRTCSVEISQDNKNWDDAYTLHPEHGGRFYVPLKDYESRYLRLQLSQSSSNGFGIMDIAIKEFKFSETRQNLFKAIAADNPTGYFPRYFYNQQNYWTIVGVNNDRKEALLSEDGAVEVDKAAFSIEPFVRIGDRLISWNNVAEKQSLADDYLPLPSVKWTYNDISLNTSVFADGPADSSILYLNYILRNNSPSAQNGDLFLAIRPFQVNSPWQFLNRAGGVSSIHSIQIKKDEQNDANPILVDKDKKIFALTPPQDFGATNFDNGEIVRFLAEGELPQHSEMNDDFGMASAALRYSFNLQPGEERQVVLAVPFHQSDKYLVHTPKDVDKRREAVKALWWKKLNTVHFDLPASADHLINTIRSNLAYILINRDGYGIQPGSRSYERSWIRDGSLTSSALLKMGIQQEVHDYLDWYCKYQYPSGKVPCVVDRRGPDPVPENDSNGELIFGLLQYYLFTGDKAFLEQHFENVKRAIAYMDTLRALRMTDVYRTGTATQKACYGLLPESISHEGYSAKPMHSYWDDFFGIKGYKDAVHIATILGKKRLANQYAVARDTFHNDLYRSIRKAIANKGIDYIPGCAELGDFDATSTAIAVYPCNELENLPEPYARNTFDRYYDYFEKRRDGVINSEDYTPYEIRLIGTFIYFGQPDRAHALINFFFKDQRPFNWNQWAEVVRKHYRDPGFIGDMPHTWVGSDFISAARSMFVYEDELNKALVIGAGLYRDWLDSDKGVAVSNLPTYWGMLNYTIHKTDKGYAIKIDGDVKLPYGGLRIHNFRNKRPTVIRVNGLKISTFDDHEISIKEFPARVDMEY